MKRSMIEFVRNVERCRKEYVKSAEGCPRPVAEAMSREKLYDQLFDAASIICAYLEDNEDDLK